MKAKYLHVPNVNTNNKATRKTNLKNHIKSVHEGQTFPCQYCKYKATQKCHIQRHIKSVHEGQ